MKKPFMLLFVLFVLVGTLLACGASDSNTGTLSNSDTNTKTQDQKKDDKKPAAHFKVGDKVKVGNKWEVAINEVKTHEGTEFSKPANGNIYVLVDVTTSNISDDEGNISSLLNFNLKDSEGRKGKDALFVDDSITPAPNGKVPAGDKLRGTLTYEVSADMKKFTLSFEDNLFASGQTIWDINL